MPDVPGKKWEWLDEPEEGAIVRGEEGGLYQRIGSLWFDYSRFEDHDDDGYTWPELLEAQGTLYLWRPLVIGDFVDGDEIMTLPLSTLLVNNETGHAAWKIRDHEWYGVINAAGRIPMYAWTDFIGGKYQIAWMPSERKE